MALTEIRYLTKYDHPEEVVMASSRSVANTFDTFHENIIDIIDSIFKKARQEVSLCSKISSMFTSTKVVDEDGKEQVEYYMDKDGFLLVMMKLTGNGKLETLNMFWVVEYLSAFNKLQEQIIKKRYLHDYTTAHPDTRLQISDILHNASMQGSKKLEAALVYFADYIPDRLNEIYRPEARRRRA